MYDHFDERPCEYVIESLPQYGMERLVGMDDSIPNGNLPTVKFKMFDDDGGLMCSGELDDDPDCANQSAALRWGESMYGCTVIKVERDRKFVQEIA